MLTVSPDLHTRDLQSLHCICAVGCSWTQSTSINRQQLAVVLHLFDICRTTSAVATAPVLVVQALRANAESRKEQRSCAQRQFRPAIMRRFLLRWRQTASLGKQWLAGVQSTRRVAQALAAWRLYLQVSICVALRPQLHDCVDSCGVIRCGSTRCHYLRCGSDTRTVSHYPIYVALCSRYLVSDGIGTRVAVSTASTIAATKKDITKG